MYKLSLVAFDRVSHQHQFHKLYHYGIRGNLLKWLKDFPTDQSQRVLVNGAQSDLASVTSGVPQGTVLAPLLFLCFINDLLHSITSTVRLYADDVLLYRSIHSVEDCCNLQQLKRNGQKNGTCHTTFRSVNFYELQTNLTLFLPNMCQIMKLYRK